MPCRGTVRVGATGFALGLCGATGILLNGQATFRAWHRCEANVTYGNLGDGIFTAIASCCIVWSTILVLLWAKSLYRKQTTFNALHPPDIIGSGPFPMVICLLGANYAQIVKNFSAVSGKYEEFLPRFVAFAAFFVYLGLMVQVVHMSTFFMHVGLQWWRLKKKVPETKKLRCGCSLTSAPDHFAAIRLPEPCWFPSTVSIAIVCLTGPQVGIPGYTPWVMTLGMNLGYLVAALTVPVVLWRVLVPTEAACVESDFSTQLQSPTDASGPDSPGGEEKSPGDENKSPSVQQVANNPSIFILQAPMSFLALGFLNSDTGPCDRWQLIEETTLMNTTQWVRDTPRVDLAPDVAGPILTFICFGVFLATMFAACRRRHRLTTFCEAVHPCCMTRHPPPDAPDRLTAAEAFAGTTFPTASTANSLLLMARLWILRYDCQWPAPLQGCHDGGVGSIVRDALALFSLFFGATTFIMIILVNFQYLFVLTRMHPL